MSDTLAVSGSVTSNAGETDALSKAFDAAAKDIDFSGASFEKGAMDPPDPVIEQPVDEPAPENAAGGVTEGEQETAEEKAQRLRDEKGRFAKGEARWGVG